MLGARSESARSKGNCFYPLFAEERLGEIDEEKTGDERPPTTGRT